MNAQSLPDDALFQKVHLLVIEIVVCLCVLLDVFQREGNVAYLVVAHACACVSSGLVARDKVRVDVDTIGGFALDDEPAFIECRADTAVIHYLFNHARLFLACRPVLLFGSVYCRSR